jgi:photosystem II stability/assembly factor-like uncharacterized protein
VVIGLFLLLGLSQSSSFAATRSTSAAETVRLQSFDFSNPTTGLGVFTEESLSGDKCTDFVGKSNDGGAHFASLVPVMSWNCSTINFSSLIASDGHGDVFLFGPQFFVSHNNGKTWSKGQYSGSVIDLDAVGRSIWMVRSFCTPEEIDADSPCATKLDGSIDGGRTWHSIDSPSTARAGSPVSALMQSYLVRTSRNTAYLMFAPRGHPNGSSNVAPLWLTTNGGRTWSNRQVPCHIDAGSSSFSLAPEGSLMTVCASEPSAGFQPKTVLTSVNGGKAWELETPNVAPYSNIDNGYLGSIDLVSSKTAFLVGGRSSLLETLNGGRSWQAVKPLIGSTAGGTSEVRFFNQSDGLVLGNDDNDDERLTLWSTSDGGAHWKVVLPKTSL